MCMERLSRSINDVVQKNEWCPINISRSGPKISYSFFADDLTLFAIADQKNCSIIISTLNSFNQVSSQKINLAKSKVFFYANFQPHQMETNSNRLSIHASTTFGKYLGLPIFHKRIVNSDF